MSKNHFLPFQINTIIFIFVNCLQNGCRRPFWMSETHFRWHFGPFQINTKLFFKVFYKMATGAHFGCPKFNFDRISGHFRSIHNFNLFLNFSQNGCRRPFWVSKNHFWSHFPAILDQYETPFFLIFYKMITGAHFGCPKFTFDCISGHFRSIRNINFLDFL